MAGFLEKKVKKAYLLPIGVSLFFIPIFWNPSFVYAFTQGKEIFFKAILLATLTGLGLVLILKKPIQSKNPFRSTLFLVLLSLITLFTITDVLSPHPLVTLHGTFSRGFGLIMEWFFFFFTLYVGLTIDKKSIRPLLKLSFLSGILVSVYAMIQKIGFDPFFSHFSTTIFAGRAFSSLGNPSYLGQFMLLIVLIGGYLTFSAKTRLHRIGFILGSFICLAAMLLSETRTAILGLALSVVLFGLKYRHAFFQQIKKYWIPIALSFGIIITILANVHHGRFSLSNTGLRSLDSRFEIWNGTLELIKQKPWLGYGSETFYVHFPEIANKRFFQLEENINLSADRVHNEFLETFFSHGIFAVMLYVALFVLVVRIFFISKDPITSLLALLILINTIQNQLSFPDTSIVVLMAFCYGGLIAIELKNQGMHSWKPWSQKIVGLLMLLIAIHAGIFSVYKPYRSQLAYTQSKNSYSTDYAKAIHKHKEALNYTPYYSEPWYELMIIDPSSMKTALLNLEKIEGESGNVLAWKGNYYSESDPAKASEFYMRALEKNPYHPNWIRAFADMLYDQGDYPSALFLYQRYLESIPDFWKWSPDLEERSPSEQKTYETFLKYTPYFSGILKKIDDINEKLGMPKK